MIWHFHHGMHDWVFQNPGRISIFSHGLFAKGPRFLLLKEVPTNFESISTRLIFKLVGPTGCALTPTQLEGSSSGTVALR